ncbi:MAG: ABC transporter ATP-binding protein, partial [Caldilinea sp.]|nr:ABC transporter ATP-binding protein [Caldilinea sp.]
NLCKYFPVRRGVFARVRNWVKAVDDVSFTVERGETLGLVGESGCGKTTLGRALLRLTPLSSGSIRVGGVRVDDLSESDFRPYRRRLQMVFQDPTSTLDPRWRVGESIGEALDIHGLAASAADRRDRIARLLDSVGLPADSALRHPHEFSGGQRQRIGIARALVVQPKLVIADEPVSALDVSIQAQILNLLKDLQESQELTYLFVSHNMAVIRYISDRIAVMYAGKLVELGPKQTLLNRPQHPYTELLLAAVPRTIDRHQRTITAGEPPDLARLPSGCVFRTRCKYAQARCAEEEPQLQELDSGHFVSCHFAADLSLEGVVPRVHSFAA